MSVHVGNSDAALIIISYIRKQQQPCWWLKKLYKNCHQYGNRLMDDMHSEGVNETVQNLTQAQIYISTIRPLVLRHI